MRISDWSSDVCSSDLPYVRMVDHDQVIAARQFLDREALEILQRAAVPGDRLAAGLRPCARRGHQRIVAARMVPRHSPHVALPLPIPVDSSPNAQHSSWKEISYKHTN